MQGQFSCLQGWEAVPRGAGWPTLPAPLALGRFSCFFETPSRQCPWAGEGGGRPQGLSLCSLGDRRGSGLRKSRSAAARPRKSSRRAYRIVWLRGSVSTYIQNCLSTWEPLWGPKKVVHDCSPEIRVSRHAG